MMRRILLLTVFLLIPLVAPLSAADGACQSLSAPDVPSQGLVALSGGASACALADPASQSGGTALSARACAVTNLPTDDVRHLCLDGDGDGFFGFADGGVVIGTAQKADWNYADGFSSSGGTPCTGCVTPPISIHLQSFLGPAIADVYDAGAYSCATTYPAGYDILVTCTAIHAPPTGHWECVNTDMAAHPRTPETTITGTLGCHGTTISATGHGNRNPWPNANGVVTKDDQGPADVITCAAHDEFPNSLSDWEVWCSY